jgi:hypothetical protein
MLEAFMRNIKLMDLIDTKFAPEKLEIIRGEQSLEAFKQICMQLNFQSILSDLDVLSCRSLSAAGWWLNDCVNYYWKIHYADRWRRS